jgi:hypothetical protein
LARGGQATNLLALLGSVVDVHVPATHRHKVSALGAHYAGQELGRLEELLADEQRRCVTTHVIAD